MINPQIASTFHPKKVEAAKVEAAGAAMKPKNSVVIATQKRPTPLKFLTGQLIDQTGKDLSPGEDRFVWDQNQPGFGVRIKGKSVRWVCQYRVNGKTRRQSIGDTRKVTEETARKIATIRFGLVAQGIDPTAGKKKEKEAAAAVEKQLTFGAVVERYIIARDGLVRPKTVKLMRYRLIEQCAPLADRPLNGIKLADITALCHDVMLKTAKTCANHDIKGTALAGRNSAGSIRSYILRLYNWAIGEGLCENNPAIGANNLAEGMKPRSRVLSDRELALVWEAAGEAEFGKIIKLLILTGCRRAEIGGLRWSELDMEAGLLKLPEARTKNGAALTLSLPPMAMDILRAVLPRGNLDNLFWNSARPTPFSDYDYMAKCLRTRTQIKDHWTLHDLRRTFRTGLSRLGVPSHIAERCINHVRGGIEAVYDRYLYDAEMKDALQKWADHVAKITASNVVGMKRKRA